MKRFWKTVAMRVAVQWLSPSAILILSLTWMAWHVWPHIQTAAVALTDAKTGLLHKASGGIDDILAESRNVTVQLVDKGRPGKPETMGLIPATRQVMMDTGKAVEGINTQVAENGTLATAAVKSLGAVSDKLGDTADALTDELGSLKTTTDTLPGLIGEARTNLQKLQPVEDNASQSLADFDKLLNSKGLLDAINGTGTTAQNLGKVSGDVYAWEHPMLNPDPCKTKSCTFGRAMKGLEGITVFGANASQFTNLFRPIPVQVQK